MPEPLKNPLSSKEEPRLDTLRPPMREGVSALSRTPSDLTLSPEHLNRLISALEYWGEALSNLTGAISCHPETTEMLRKAASTTENNAHAVTPGQIKLEEIQCEELLSDARSDLGPYKRFFTEWLSGEEFFELLKNVWRPLPTEPPTQGAIKTQIEQVGGLEFYRKLRSTWQSDSSHPQIPDREELLELVGKLARFCGWEAKDPMALPFDVRTLPPLSDIREIRETLVTMLVLIDNLLATQAPSRSILLPHLGGMQIDASEEPGHNP